VVVVVVVVMVVVKLLDWAFFLLTRTWSCDDGVLHVAVEADKW